MKKILNPNSIFFLYEGETEIEFYKILFQKHLRNKNIRLSSDCLRGINVNPNRQIEGKIIAHLSNKKELKNINVFIAVDREGLRHLESKINIASLTRKFVYQKSRIKSINEIVATQTIESWFFHDIEGIYNYLHVPKNQRNHNKYLNVDATNHQTLSQLFRRFNKTYSKGRASKGFIESLDHDKIYDACEDLRLGISKMLELTSK